MNSDERRNSGPRKGTRVKGIEGIDIEFLFDVERATVYF